jgi:hypothetical protein
MRMMPSMTLCALALAGLAGCGGEESYRANLRTQALANCRNGSNAAVASQLSQVGMTFDQLCTCAIDRYMRATSYDQLKQDQNNPAPQALVTASTQCLSEHMQRANGAAANAIGPQTMAPPATDPTADAANAMDAAAGEAERAAAEVENATGDK